MVRSLFAVAGMLLVLVCFSSHAVEVVGVGETTLCSRNFSTPLLDPGSSDASVPLVLRSRSQGGFLQGADKDIAYQGFEFLPLMDQTVSITVPNIVFDGLLAALGAGGVNHARVRIMAYLRESDSDENLDIDVVHDRTHSAGGPVADGNTFEPVDAHLEHEVEAGKFYTIFVRVETEAQGTSAQADYLSGAGEAGTGGRRVTFACVKVVSDIEDSDGDGIPDEWEINGVGDLDLPAMGATADHKDLFVEVDWLEDHGLNRAAVLAVKEAFKRAPLDNPDDETGVRLHVDAGDLTDANASEDGAGPGSCGDGVNNDPTLDSGAGQMDGQDPDCLVGDLVFSTLAGGSGLGEGNEILLTDVPNGANLADLSSDLDGNELSDFYEVRETHFEAGRLLVFTYGIRATTSGLGGQAELGGASMILGTASASTFMHEIGHTLGLEHGGNEADTDEDQPGEEGNCKPNYVSIMNYFHSFNGGIPTRGADSGQDLDGDGSADGKIVDFSPPRFVSEDGRGQAPLDTLSEDSLDDDTVLDSTDADNRFIFVDKDGLQVMRALNGPADWNNGPGEESPLNINTSNADGFPPVCTNDRTDDVIEGFDDWSHIKLGIQGFGTPADGPYNPTTGPEPTEEDMEAFIAGLNTTDLGVTKSHSPALAVAGQPLTWRIEVTNHGPNPARRVEVVDALPPEVQVKEIPDFCSHAAGVVTCDLGELEYDASVEFEIATRLAVDLACRGHDRVFVANSAVVKNLAGPDSNPANNRADDRAEVLCVKYEYAAKVLCGVQPDADDLRLATGIYATSVNVHNPNDGDVSFFKKLALAYPPAVQSAGRILPIAVDSLAYDEALKTDCNELRKIVHDDISEDTTYFEGFVVVQSPRSLDVTSVYSTAALDHQGRAAGHSSVDVENVPERRRKPRPNLNITKRAATLGVTAPLVTYTVVVENRGAAIAQGIVIRDEVEMVSGTLTVVDEGLSAASHGEGWKVTAFTADGANLEARITSLQPGETATLTFAVRATTDIQAGQTRLNNTATVESDPQDSTPEDNTVTIGTVIAVP